MPEMDGIEFLQGLPSDTPKSLVLVEDDLRMEALFQNGAHGVVVKSPKAGLPIASWQGTEILKKIYSILELPEPDYCY